MNGKNISKKIVMGLALILASAGSAEALYISFGGSSYPYYSNCRTVCSQWTEVNEFGEIVCDSEDCFQCYRDCSTPHVSFIPVRRHIGLGFGFGSHRYRGHRRSFGGRRGLGGHRTIHRGTRSSGGRRRR